MTTTEKLLPINLDLIPDDVVGVQKKLPKNYFALLFLLLLEAMTVRQNTILTQSKMIAANSHAQNLLNKANGEIKFSSIHYGATQATINRIQDRNQQYAADRQNLQNNLITLRQTGQVEMTGASTDVNILEQDASENSGWIKTLSTIFSVIDEMTQQ